MHYSLFGNVSSSKIYPGILNISLSISIAHQSIDILKFSVCHLHQIMCIKKLLNEKIASSGSCLGIFYDSYSKLPIFTFSNSFVSSYGLIVMILGFCVSGSIAAVHTGDVGSSLKMLVPCKFYYI